MLFKRNILSVVKDLLNEYPVVLITGARQVGKTTLVSFFEKENGYKYLSFDDESLVLEAKSNPRVFLDKYDSPLILDEIQKVTPLFSEIERRVNEVRRTKGSQSALGMYILTGSQRYNLMKEVSESMSGRVAIVEMSPLSQREIRGWEGDVFSIKNEILANNAEIRHLSNDDLFESIVRGFYPARWEIEGKPITNFYSNYVKTYLERDVSQLLKIYEKGKFENFLKVVASLTGEEFVPDNIAKVVGVDKNTVSSWANLLVAGDMVTLIPPYYEDSINKRIVKRSKLYFNDTGLACYLLGIDTTRSLKLSSFKGRIVETYIVNEIRKTYLNKGIDPQIFHYRDNNQNEIDLIILKNGSLDLVECKSGTGYGVSDIKGFKQLSATKYEIGGTCILSLDIEPERIASGTFAFPLKTI